MLNKQQLKQNTQEQIFSIEMLSNNGSKHNKLTWR